MGCDIHLHTEVKMNGKWEHLGCPDVPRMYALYAKMAGVRNNPKWNIIPISEPKGLPKDISYITKFDADRWDRDGHSHSWLAGDEIDQLETWYNEWWNKQYSKEYSYIEERLLGYVFGNGWNVQKYPENYPKELTDARIVFWFDN